MGENNPRNAYKPAEDLLSFLKDMDEKDSNSRMQSVINVEAKRRVLQGDRKRRNQESSATDAKDKSERPSGLPRQKLRRRWVVKKKQTVESDKGWLQGMKPGKRVWVNNRPYEVSRVGSNKSVLVESEVGPFGWIYYLIREIGKALWKSL